MAANRIKSQKSRLKCFGSPSSFPERLFWPDGGSSPGASEEFLSGPETFRRRLRTSQQQQTRFEETPWSEPNDCSQARKPFVLTNPYNFSLDIRMPGVTPAVSDTYYCMAVPVPTSKEAYIDLHGAHIVHIDIAMLEQVLVSEFKRRQNSITPHPKTSVCLQRFDLTLPASFFFLSHKDVGFRVGGDTRITYFVLQIHYGDVRSFKDHHKDCSGLNLQMTSKPQPFIAGMYLMMSVDTVIPPGKTVTNADIACTYSSYPMYPFAFRTHTHRLGKVVSGYRIRNGQWSLIGRQSPQLPQAFYPASNAIDVRYGDLLAARCVFTGEGKTTKTQIGGTSNDEMCNFYMMYYMDSKHAVPYMDCMDHGSSSLFRNIPDEANVPIVVTPDQMMVHGSENKDGKDDTALQQPKREEEALDQGRRILRSDTSFMRQDFVMGAVKKGFFSRPICFTATLLRSVAMVSSNQKVTVWKLDILIGDFYSLLSKLLGERKDIVHVHKYNPTEAHADLVAEIDSIMQKKDLGWRKPRLGYAHRDGAVLVRDRVHKFHQLESTVRPPGTKIVPARLPGPGVAMAKKQGTHLEEVSGWPEVTLQLGQVSGLALDSDENLVIFHRGDHRWGVNSFNNGAIYQQKSLGPIQQSTILVVDPVKGSVLKASGRNMFYMPHGITTDKDNNYWVTDVALHQAENVGLRISDHTTGSLDRRRRVPFQIPHSLAFAADKRELLVADRENGRVQCFMADTGEFVKEIKKDEFGGEVFAVSYSPTQGGLIYVVNGESAYGQSAPLRGFVLNYSTKEILDVFAPDTQKFKMPHDIVVAKDGSVFVGDAASDSVIKFLPSEKAEHRSVKKGGIEVQEIEETETFVQAKLKPIHKQMVHTAEVTVQKLPVAQEKETAPVQQIKAPEEKEEDKENEKKSAKTQGMSPAVLTTLLLLLPLVLVITIGVFIRWKKSRMYGDGHEVKLEPSGSSGGILGKLRGKAAGTLNLGNFFATHKGYTRQGFDRLSTEGSDLEKDDEDATDSENEEYSAPPPPVSSS
ncbi:peptidyl-glycine alpha-amidating monooxygenase isoform X3 [Silurus meridionalis]|nr:peptidyl-glycine alpha-amidating monooxygenase isoform X3 [Silurus meridionalis]